MRGSRDYIPEPSVVGRSSIPDQVNHARKLILVPTFELHDGGAEFGADMFLQGLHVVFVRDLVYYRMEDHNRLFRWDVVVQMVHEMHHRLDQADIKIGNIDDPFNTFLYPFSPSFAHSRACTHLPWTAKLFGEILRMTEENEFVDCKFAIPASYDCVGEVLVVVEPK